MASLKPAYGDPYWRFNEWVTRWKNGNPRYLHFYEVTWLRRCDHCGLVATPKRIAYRSECYVPEWGDLGTDIQLCMACWNKFRQLVRAHWLVAECRSLINKVVRRSVMRRTA